MSTMCVPPPPQQPPPLEKAHQGHYRQHSTKERESRHRDRKRDSKTGSVPTREQDAVVSSSASPSSSSSVSTNSSHSSIIKMLIKSSAVPASATVESIKPYALPPNTAQLQRYFEAKISDGSSVILSLPPPLMVKLLRSERASVGSEAAVLSWIAESGLGGLGSIAAANYWEWEKENEGSNSGPSTGNGKGKGKDEKKRVGQSDYSQQLIAAKAQGMIPGLIAHSPAITLSSPEFNIVKPNLGSPLSLVWPSLSIQERRAASFHTGRFIRRISKLQSPNGTFGPALGVLGSPIGSSSKRGGWETSSDSWTMAFATLLEGVLRDGEDMQVTLSYSTIRGHFSRFQPYLDAVTIPALVVVNSGEQDNVLVIRDSPSSSTTSLSSKSGSTYYTSSSSKSSKSHRYSDKPTSSKSRKRDKESSSSSSSKKKSKEKTSSSSSSSSSSSTSHSSSPSKTTSYLDSPLSITGLRDWSQSVFGDPLFSTAFSAPQEHTKTLEFWSGFDSALEGEETDSLGSPNCLIEDWANAKIRMLLYECYHCVTRVVREFYRPSKESSKRELAARKALNTVLTKLEGVAVAENKSSRRRRGSGEMSPAKRWKAEDEGDGEDEDESEEGDGHGYYDENEYYE